MWEICIETNSGELNYIEYINQKMKNTIKATGAVTSFSLTKNSISFGCTKEQSAKVWGVLRFVLCDIFCEKMKKDFLLKNVQIVPQSKGFFEPFIKVLTYFDTELERQIVLRSIVYSKKIVLESFLNFKLRPLKNKWKELCNLTNNNSLLFLQSETFIELLKFLIANLEPKKDCIILSFQSPCIMYEEHKNNIISVGSFEPSDDFGLISELIELCPNKIKVIAGNNSNGIINLLTELFEGKVELIKK